MGSGPRGQFRSRSHVSHDSRARTKTAVARVAADRLQPVSRRERNKQEKRARIVEAARQLFQEKGFAQTTTLEIAEAADIGTGTLFLYARSKEDLLILVFKDEMLETAMTAFARLRAEDPLLDQLVQVFDAMASHHERDRDLAKILLREIMFPANGDRLTDIAELMDAIFAGLAALLTTAQAAGILRAKFDPRLVAENLFSNYFMDMLEWLRGLWTKEAFRDRLRQHLAITIDGLR
ncbi:MAG: TetR/AcrR family transcriptional regulator [Proteobacteria bacterium]|nr:TetR/AcrR family transcriptional regulator [Pseudomonadota bacterium]